MARADHIKALLRAYNENHEAQFLSIALQVAADEANRGHNKLAMEIRELVDQAKGTSTPRSRLRALPLAQPKGELADLLTVQYPQQHLAQMVTSSEVHQKISRILKEQRQHVRLNESGLNPRRKLLLVGPPGTGKTLTSSVLATELRLPLFTVRFDSLINKFMGESASKLRLVFDALKSTRGVYLFDEFDSLGLQRGSQHDVAEMRRTLNMFLQLIEQDSSDSLIVAATNHGEALDHALFRRFDDVIHYAAPVLSEIEQLIKNSVALMAPRDLDYAAIAKQGLGLSHSDIVRACTDALKDAVLEDSELINEQSVIQHMVERRKGQGRLI